MANLNRRLISLLRSSLRITLYATREALGRVNKADTPSCRATCLSLDNFGTRHFVRTRERENSRADTRYSTLPILVATYGTKEKTQRWRSFTVAKLPSAIDIHRQTSFRRSASDDISDSTRSRSRRLNFGERKHTIVSTYLQKTNWYVQSHLGRAMSLSHSHPQRRAPPMFCFDSRLDLRLISQRCELAFGHRSVFFHFRGESSTREA